MTAEVTEGEEIVVTARLTQEDSTSRGGGDGGGGGDAFGWGCFYVSYGSGSGTYFDGGPAGSSETADCPPTEEPQPEKPQDTETHLDMLKWLDELGSKYVDVETLPSGDEMATIYNRFDGNYHVFGFDDKGNAELRGIYPSPMGPEPFTPSNDPLPGGDGWYA
jgi:hypothetical protein